MDAKAYFSIWNDSWKMFRRYIEKPPVSEQDWNDVLSDLSDFSKTHGEPAIKMATMMFGLLDAEYKKHGNEVTAKRPAR